MSILMRKAPRISAATLASALVFADGNSLTAGQGGHSYPAHLATLLGKTVTNYGVGGQTTPQMRADAATQVHAAFHAANLNILIANEVRNDVAVNSVTARQAVNTFWLYCDEAKAAAAAANKLLKIIVWNTLPNAATTSVLGLTELNSRLDAANAFMRDEWRAHADSFVDVRSDPRLAVAELSSSLWLDGIHLTSAGELIQAHMFRAAILNLRA